MYTKSFFNRHGRFTCVQMKMLIDVLVRADFISRRVWHMYLSSHIRRSVVEVSLSSTSENWAHLGMG